MQDVKPANRAAAQEAMRSSARSSKKRFGKFGILSIVVIIVVIVAAGVAYYFVNGGSQVDSSKYQAVFLNNNQVYFGKLHSYGTDQPYLTNVWYIQTPVTSSSVASAAQSSQLQLQQLTKSVHGPEDEMILNKSQVLFVENLASDSQVVKLINSNK